MKQPGSIPSQKFTGGGIFTWMVVAGGRVLGSRSGIFTWWPVPCMLDNAIVSSTMVWQNFPVVWYGGVLAHSVAFSHGGQHETGVEARVNLPQILRFLKFFVSPLLAPTGALIVMMC